MFEMIKANKRRSALLIVSFIVLLSLVGAAFGLLFGAGPTGAIIALVFSGIMAFASYWKADSIALAVHFKAPIVVGRDLLESAGRAVEKSKTEDL